MSGTDRTEYHRQPCLCGAGHLVVEWNEPDHWYPTRSGDWALLIECETCQRDYQLVEQHGSVIVVRRGDVERRNALDRERWSLSEQIMRSHHTQMLRRALEERLDAQRSAAAAHRLLTQADVLSSYSIARFRKRVKAGGHAAVVDDVLSSWNLSRVARLLGRDTAPVDIDLRRMEELGEAVKVPFTGVGAPIYKLGRN